MTDVRDVVDGERPSGSIVRETTGLGAEAGWDESEHVENVRRFFQQMATWGHFQFEIR